MASRERQAVGRSVASSAERAATGAGPVLVALAVILGLAACSSDRSSPRTDEAGGATDEAVATRSPTSEQIQGHWHHRAVVGERALDLAISWDGEWLIRWTDGVITSTERCAVLSEEDRSVVLSCRGGEDSEATTRRRIEVIADRDDSPVGPGATEASAQGARIVLAPADDIVYRRIASTPDRFDPFAE